MDWLLGLLARFFASVFKDWRRDEELKEKGRDEQRADDMNERERLRREADQIKREADGDDIVREDDL